MILSILLSPDERFLWEPSIRYAHRGPPTLFDQNQPILEGDSDRGKERNKMEFGN